MTSYAPRLPRLSAALPLRGTSVALALALVPLCVWGGYVALARSNAFDVRTIAIGGGDPGLEQQARAALVTSIDGRSLLRLSASQLEQRLEQLPSVRAAYVDRDFPSTLRVRLVSEAPLAIARYGRSYVELSARGRVLRALPLRPRPLLPAVIVGASGRPAPTAGSFLQDGGGRAALDAVRALPRDFGGRVWRVAQDEHGALSLRLESGLEIRLGPDLDLARKLQVAALFLQRFPRTVRLGLAYVDVSSPGHPVVCPSGGDPSTAAAATAAGVVASGPCVTPPPDPQTASTSTEAQTTTTPDTTTTTQASSAG